MKLLFVGLVALAAAVVAAHYVAEDPGFIVIGYGGRVVRTTFAFFVVLLLLAFLLLHGLINASGRLRTLPGRWQHWRGERRRQRAHGSLADGLLALAAGDFKRAERLFSHGADEQLQPEAHYLSAAAAAHGARAPARRDNYLALAASARPEARDAIALKRAEWLMETDQLSEAQPLVERLAEADPGNPQVLRLRLALARRTYDYETQMALIPALRRDRVLSPEDADALERATAVALLSRADQTLEALDGRWQALPRDLRSDAEIISAYVRGLCRHGAHDRAETLVRKRLDRAWDTALAALYGEIACEPPTRQLRRLEAWAATHGDDPGLRLARARQAIRAGLWGQAREQLQHLIARAPSPLLLELLAEIADGTGDATAAAQHRKTGLELALGATPHKPPPALEHKTPGVVAPSAPAPE